MKADLLCSINQCDSGEPIVCEAADVRESGDMVVIGANALAIVSQAADGATQRAADQTAGKLPRADRWTPLYRAPHVKVLKKAGVDTIAAGTKVWWNDTQGYAVTALSQAANADHCYHCGTTIKLSDDTADEVEITFDGRMTAQEHGTGG